MCKRNVCLLIFALEKGHIDFAQNAHERERGSSCDESDTLPPSSGYAYV